LIQEKVVINSIDVYFFATRPPLRAGTAFFLPERGLSLEAAGVALAFAFGAAFVFVSGEVTFRLGETLVFVAVALGLDAAEVLDAVFVPAGRLPRK
jgi:hypothetical protein